MIYQHHAVRYVLLYSVGHCHTYYAVAAQSLNTKGGNHTAVLATGYSYNGVTTISVGLKPVSNPLDHLVFYLFGIECFHICKINPKGQTPIMESVPFNYLIERLFLFQRFHVGVDVLNIIILIKTLNNLVDGLALLGGNILQIVRDTGELSGLNLKSVLLKPLLDCGV